MSPRLTVSDEARHHLERVLRSVDGALVSYTDGDGMVGSGVYAAGAIERGDEELVARPLPRVTVAVAPPRSTHRVRFLVEKLAELGVAEITWLESHSGRGKPPRREKAMAWAAAALEQSRGAHLTVTSGPTASSDLGPGCLYAVPNAAPLGTIVRTRPDSATLAIGPEGGFDAADLPPDAIRVGLGPRVLRVETAAVVGATLLLNAGH